MMVLLSKVCSGCRANLPLTEFCKDGRGYGDGFKPRCKECRRLTHNSWKDRTGYVVRGAAKIAKSWRTANKEHIRRYAKLYREKNRLDEYDRHNQWRLRNLGRVTAAQAAYEAQKLLALPKWANKEYICLWYKFSKMEEERTGRKCHVDHIVPLRSESVCGLHCEDNMQILFREENASKSNRWWSDSI